MNAHRQREPELPTGTLVAGATVDGIQASGSTAVVYRGHHDGDLVAIKVAVASASVRSEHRFRNEARLSSAVTHPGIVPALAVGQLNTPDAFAGRMFVMSPLIEGLPLSAELAYHHDGMREPMARTYGRQLADILYALHTAGIVHRDIKPAHLILDDAGQLHLIDFGIAYALGTSHVERTEDVTLRGAAPGSTSYMSPQQLIHAEVTPQFDIFAFGASMFELLTGSAPESDVDEDEVATRRRSPSWTPPPLDTTSELASLTLRCLAPDPAQRPSAEEICAFFDDGDAPTTVGVPSVRDDAPSAPTILHKRPSIIAEGARPARDATLTGFARPRAVEEGTSSAASDKERPLSSKTELPAYRDEDKPGSQRKLAALGLVLLLVGTLTTAMTYIVLSGTTDEDGTKTAPASVATGPAEEQDSDLGPVAEPEPRPSPQEDAAPPEPQAETPATTGPTAEPAPANPSIKKAPRPPRKKQTAPALPAVDDEPVENTPTCKKSRADAERAHEQGSPRAVLKLSQDKKCWKGHGEDRRFLRAQAYLDVGDYEACAREGKSAKSADTRAFAKICQAKLNKSP